MPTSSIPASGGGGLTPKLQKFTSSGTFTLPDGYGAAKPLLIDIQVIGGGGAGSGGQTNAGSTFSGYLAASQNDYFGNGTVYLSNAITLPAQIAGDVTNTQNGSGGGSGGLAKTQMYLTSNLTITVGAAGTRPAAGTPTAPTGEASYFWRRDMSNSNAVATVNRDTYNATNFTIPAGGAGGTSTAGSVSATGGNAAAAGTASYQWNITANNWARVNGYTPSISAGPTVGALSHSTANSVGTGGQPAGSNGGATPLLGALAGGSGTTTPVYGAFGVGGKRGDATTHSGVDGTGGGYGSIGASGAVIITYWS